MKHVKLLSLCIICALATACTSSRPAADTAKAPSIPSVMTEFRAAWVATVANINWPSKPGLSTREQQQEAIDLLDFLKNHHYNAVIFQVRPQADALYESKLEPWSYFLTGEQGLPPSPYYDPLAFWIEAAHDRGLELHVWLNPYRSHHISGGPVTEKSMVKTHPELMVHLKEGYWWFDPALKATQDHGVEVVMDLVRRYDIDGVHFDDYFYPYASYNKGEDFPDTASRRQYLAGGGTLSVGDWRRASVNSFIERLYKEIKKEKQHVKFGISPFGIWRPGHPASVQGLDQYNELYADAKLWLNKGWVDYFSPQLYWPIRRINQSFPVLLGWWDSENTAGRHLWPGSSVGRDTSLAGTTELFNQIMITRGMLPGNSGLVHWSISSVTRNPAMAKMLIEGPYMEQALVPSFPWLGVRSITPPTASVLQEGDSALIRWHHPHETGIFKWIVYYQYEQGPVRYKIFNRKETSATLAAKQGTNRLKMIRVSAVDRLSNESYHTVLREEALD